MRGMAGVKPTYRHSHSGSNKVDDDEDEDEAVGPEYDLTFNQSYLNYLSLPSLETYFTLFTPLFLSGGWSIV
jgi:hypothetical protein